MQLRATRLTCIGNAVRRAVAPPAFTPLFFFSNNEQGIWLDPSDPSTMFQDAAGTVPVTAVEQPVGRILDKSGRGNHATQATATARPVLSARVNLLTKTEQFDDGVWVKTNATASKETITPNASVAGRAAQTVSIGASTPVYFQLEIKQGTSTQSRLLVRDEINSFNFIQATAITWSGGVPSVGGVSAGIWSTPVSMGDGWYLVTATGSPNPGAALSISVQVFPDSLSGTGSLLARKADLRPANQSALPYQRVNTPTDYDDGPAFPRYLKFDGIDDSLVTPIITPGTDKVQVFVGVRKLSDATGGVIFETATSSSFDGALRAYAGNSSTAAGPHYTFETRGTLPVPLQALNSYAAPITNILTGIGNISGDSAILRINGTQVVSSIADQGTGNYLAYPLYIGRRAGTSLPANIQLYQLTARFGPNLSIETIQQAETFFNSKTGAF